MQKYKIFYIVNDVLKKDEKKFQPEDIAPVGASHTNMFFCWKKIYWLFFR